jgi:glycosyltransferase involved in cell wall biosynthesis
MTSPTSALRVLLISHSAELGGAELSLYAQALALREDGMSPIVVLPRRGPLVTLLQQEGIPTLRIYYPWMMANKPLPAPAFTMRKWLNQITATILYQRRLCRDVRLIVTNTTVIGVGHFLARLSKTPHVWLAHEVPSQFAPRSPMLSFLQNIRAKIVGNSQNTIDCWSQQTQGTIPLMPSPLSPIIHLPTLSRPATAPAAPAHEATLNLACVGRICEAKNQRLLIELARALAPAYASIHIHLVGACDQHYQELLLDEMLPALTPTNVHLRFLPQAPNPFEHIPADSLFIQSSKNETLGRTTLEAMSAGFLVVALDQGASAELVPKDLTRGVLLPASELPGSQAALLLQQLRDSHRVEKMRDAAVPFARQFSLSTHHPQFVREFLKH